MQSVQEIVNNSDSYLLLKASDALIPNNKPKTNNNNLNIINLIKSIDPNLNLIETDLNNNNNKNNCNSCNNKNIKITPLLICTNENNQIYLKESTKNSTGSNNNNNKTSSGCNCNFCLLNLAYLNSNCANTICNQLQNGSNKFEDIKRNLIDYIELNEKRTSFIKDLISNYEQDKEFIVSASSESSSSSSEDAAAESYLVRSSTPHFDRRKSSPSKTSSEEPILYIDSIEIEDSQAQSKNYSKMNLFTKLRQQKSVKQQQSQNVETDANTIKSNKQLHDYHVIDEDNVDLTPSNSVESFEFINPIRSYRVKPKMSHSQSVNEKLSSNRHHQAIPINSYEKSWENSTIILLDKLDQCLKQQQQQQENFDSKTNKLVNSCCCRNCSLVSSSTRIIPIKLPMPISNCSIREKIGSRNSASHRVSFPCSNFSSMNSSTFNSSISSSSSTSSASTTPSLSSTASSSLIQHQQQQVDGQFKLLKISKQNG